MSKLLKAVATKHRPHIAAKMTADNGYNEKKHHFADDLKKANVIDDGDFASLAGCLDDLSSTGDPAANVLKAAKKGKIDKAKLNDDDFVNALMAASDLDDVDGDDDNDDPTVN